MAGCAQCAGSDDRLAHREGHLTFALAGNPNTGKSSIFNLLTGAKQHVGNWPGKTVARRHGTFRYDVLDIEIVDLPGTYSLNATSPEETIARDYLVSGGCDIAIIVVDAANLERNLYLAVQVLETGLPAIVALNMADVAQSRGINIDAAKLADQLGVPVVLTIARSGAGLEDLKATMANAHVSGVAS